jgi:hypothetical protein
MGLGEFRLAVESHDLRDPAQTSGTHGLTHPIAPIPLLPVRTTRTPTHNPTYADGGELYDEHKYRDHLIQRLHQQAALFGLPLTPATE